MEDFGVPLPLIFGSLQTAGPGPSCIDALWWSADRTLPCSVTEILNNVNLLPLNVLDELLARCRPAPTTLLTRGDR